MTRISILLLAVIMLTTNIGFADNPDKLSYENPFKVPDFIPYSERDYKDIQYVPQEVLIVVDNTLKSATCTYFLINDKPIAETMTRLFGDMNEREKALCKRMQEIKDEIRKHWTFKIEYYLKEEAYLTLPDYPMYKVGFNEWQKFTDNVATDPFMSLLWFKHLHDVFYADSIKEEKENRIDTDHRIYYNVWDKVVKKYKYHCEMTSVDAYRYVYEKYAVEIEDYYFQYDVGNGKKVKVKYKYKKLDFAYALQKPEHDILLQHLKNECLSIHGVDEESERYKYKEPKW